MCYLNYLHLSCQIWKVSYFQYFDILVYKILVTTDPIELKFSGIREGVNKTSSFKVSKQSNMFKEKSKNMEFWELRAIGMSYGLVVLLFNQQIPENLNIKAQSARYYIL